MLKLQFNFEFSLYTGKCKTMLYNKTYNSNILKGQHQNFTGWYNHMLNVKNLISCYFYNWMNVKKTIYWSKNILKQYLTKSNKK